MKEWRTLYESKLMTADEAVKKIPDGSRVFFGHAANEPPVLVDALVRNYEQYKDVEIVHWVPMGKGEAKREQREERALNAVGLGTRHGNLGACQRVEHMIGLPCDRGTDNVDDRKRRHPHRLGMPQGGECISRFSRV